jgi:hypothetical protein
MSNNINRNINPSFFNKKSDVSYVKLIGTILIIILLLLIVYCIIKFISKNDSNMLNEEPNLSIINNNILDINQCDDRDDNPLSCTQELSILPVQGIKWISHELYDIDITIKNVLNNYGITRTFGDDWNIYIPPTYDLLQKQINDVPKNNAGKKVFMIDNIDLICGKDFIWLVLVKSYGRDYAMTLMPPTYILNSMYDLALFQNDFDISKLYIMKKNIQRQSGLLITDNIDTILKGKNNQYVVVQELLQDPYTISGMKINLRFYILLVYHKKNLKAYVYNDGFMYYTKNIFVKGNLDNDSNITTGYIDRKVYEENPLTHMDFRKYLDDNQRQLSIHEQSVLSRQQKISDYVFNNAYSLVAIIINGTKDVMCNTNSPLNDAMTFQLFGADIAINDKLQSTLMEINKGPDLSAKDDRDKTLKWSVVTDMFKIIDIIPGNQKGFIQLTL